MAQLAATRMPFPCWCYDAAAMRQPATRWKSDFRLRQMLASNHFKQILPLHTHTHTYHTISSTYLKSEIIGALLDCDDSALRPLRSSNVLNCKWRLMAEVVPFVCGVVIVCLLCGRKFMWRLLQVGTYRS